MSIKIPKQVISSDEVGSMNSILKAERYNNIAVIILETAILIMALTSFLSGSLVGMGVFLLWGHALILFWLYMFEKSVIVDEEA